MNKSAKTWPTNTRVCQLRSESASARNQMGRHPSSSTGKFAQDAYRVWPQASRCHPISGYRPNDHCHPFPQANWSLPLCHTIHSIQNEMRRESKIQYSSKTPSLSRKYYRHVGLMQTLNSLCQEILTRWHPNEEYFQAAFILLHAIFMNWNPRSSKNIRINGIAAFRESSLCCSSWKSSNNYYPHLTF